MESVAEPPRAAQTAGEGDSAKRRQILDGARTLFRQLGFDAASMDGIARAAGVSKGTLYVYFPSKQALFAELVRVDKTQAAEQLLRFDHADRDVEAVLRRLGGYFIERMGRPDTLATMQMVVGAASRFPEIGLAFYEAGPGLAIAKLAAYLEAQAEAGVLAVDDAEIAAAQFLSMCRHPLFCAMLSGAVQLPCTADMQRVVDAAVRTFMAAWAAAPPR